MRYLISDIKKIYHSRMVQISLLVLITVSIGSPIYTSFSLDPDMRSRMGHPFFWWILMSTGIAFNVLHTAMFAWPVLSTGLVFAKERLSSIETMLVTRGNRWNYLASKALSVFLATFFNFTVIFLLNILFTNLLFQTELPPSAFQQGQFYIPAEESFAWGLYQISPIVEEVGFSFLTAFYLAVLSVLTVSIQMVAPCRNLYLAFLIPLLLFNGVDFALQRFLPPWYVPKIFLQPLAACALSNAPNAQMLLIGFTTLIIVSIVIFLVGCFRSRETL